MLRKSAIMKFLYFGYKVNCILWCGKIFDMFLDLKITNRHKLEAVFLGLLSYLCFRFSLSLNNPYLCINLRRDGFSLVETKEKQII